MKKRLIYGSLVLGATLFAGCTKNFDKINTDPNKTTAALINPNYFMSQAQIQFANAGYRELLLQSCWIQGLASTEGYYTNGDKYVYGGSPQNYTNMIWNDDYGAGTLIYEMKNLVKGNAALSNLDNCGTIMLVAIQQPTVDSYGDSPYSQAYQAKTGIFTPAFDKTQTIYSTMLSQLATATAALDVSKAGPTSDLFYHGNVAQWKKLGYSLMLKLAMRLTKVDPATAQKYAEMAYTGGAMSSIADDAVVLSDAADNNSNNSANTFLNNVPDWQGVRWGKTLISYMQSNSDPRIPAIAEIAIGNGLAANAAYVPGDNTASKQLGMPNGYDIGGPFDISKAPGYPGATPANPAVTGDGPAEQGKYSRPRFAVYLDRNRASFVATYGETELLFAEAASRGWATGVAATHFANALAADMQEISQLNSTPQAVVDPAAIAAYVAAHPLVPATALQQINMEYYVSHCTTFNFIEAWNNWKRSGYPVLTPVVYPGQFTNGSIPRRVTYPVSIPQTNPAGLAAAVADQGPDNFTTRVWWDK
jgi:hypothetical protein